MIKIDELWDLYLQYLIWKCKLEKEKRMAPVFEILNDIPFRYTLKRDENRLGDGLFLRNDKNGFKIPDEFMDDIDILEEFDTRSPSVMEVLVALAIRVDNEIIGDPADPHPEEFFMEMIKNLGLDRLRKGCHKEHEIIKIIQIWINREFESNGRGSPFPVRYDHRDQRDLEIWDQMNSYVCENYI